MKSELITLILPNGDEHEVAVEFVARDQVRVLEEDIFSRKYRMGDVVAVEKIGEGRYRFGRRVRRPKLRTHTWVVAIGMLQSFEVQELLERIMRMGGFWQGDFGGMLTVKVPRELDFDFEKEFNAATDRMASNPEYAEPERFRERVEALSHTKLQLGVSFQGGVTIIDCVGRMDGSSLPYELPGIIALYKQTRVVLDLREVTAIDSNACGTLIQWNMRARSDGGFLRFVPGPAPRAVFTRTRLIQHFDCFDTIEDALQAERRDAKYNTDSGGSGRESR